MMLLSAIDLNGVGNMIANLGVPTVVCIAFGWYIWQRTKVYDTKIDDIRRENKAELLAVKEEYKALLEKTVAEYKAQLEKITEERKEDSIKFVTALDNNTAALERMADKLDEKGVTL